MPSNATLQCGDRLLPLGQRTLVMGILNLTPDSFSDGGLFTGTDAALARAEQMLAEGADVIDIGGESTRPFAAPVSPQEELARILPVVRALCLRGIRNLSIDTRNASTWRACQYEGASWLNDVSALTHDEDMVKVAQRADVVILMHAKGTPDVMQKGEISYDNVVTDVAGFLRQRIELANQAGISSERILVDPGIGFGKKLAHNLALIRGLQELKGLGAGILCGTSRKAFIGELTGLKIASERDAASLGALSASVLAGADMVRVHDVKAAVQALKIIDAIKSPIYG
jgi:dihydropteroate synthase